MIIIMLHATHFHAFKGMLELTSMHGIMFINSSSTCARIKNKKRYVKFSVHTVSCCFLLCVYKTFTPAPSDSCFCLVFLKGPPPPKENKDGHTFIAPVMCTMSFIFQGTFCSHFTMEWDCMKFLSYGPSTRRQSAAATSCDASVWLWPYNGKIQL